MRLWDHLYMGQNADRARARILKGLRQGSLLPDTYVITLPEKRKSIIGNIYLISVLYLCSRGENGRGKTCWFWESPEAIMRRRRLRDGW